MKGEGEKISKIVMTTGVGRSSVYRVLQYHDEGLLAV